MLSHQLLALAFAIPPSLVSAALFPPDSLVKIIDAKGFRKAMKVNETSMVAFVAPWCGHCQRMVPEYSKVALGLYPLVPTYAVDCDDEKNKRLCAEQGVQGFPTVKVYPRGKLIPSLTYDSPERTASGLWYFAKRAIPMVYTKIRGDHAIQPWVEKHQEKNRAFILNKDMKIPLLWQVLANKYQDQIEFASFGDRKGKGSVMVGIEGEEKVTKVLLYPAGSNSFIRYEGIQKYESLAKFFDSVIDGTADLASIIEKAKEEEFVDEAQLEIERKQEAQRMALLHGGFTNLIDFEKALKNGGAGFHDTNGYGGMGGIPKPLKKKPSAPSAATAATTASTTPDSASSETTVVPAPAQKGDEAAEEPVAAPESVKAPEPVIEDKQKPVEEENVSEQVVLEVPKDDASPAPSAERPKDEL